MRENSSERGTVGECKDGTQQLLDIGLRYDVTHVVRWVGTPLGLSKLHENADWIVCEPRERTPDETAAPEESKASDW